MTADRVERSSRPSVSTLRNLLRNLQECRSALEAGVEEFTGPDGVTWSIRDLERLFEASQKLLSPRQAEAIRMFLVEQMYEADVAEAMGLSRTNPIGMYATTGIERLIELVDRGAIKGFSWGG